MSSIKRQKTSLNDTNIRQSFDERVCDDLSEVILQYLSLEDKLRLECVSKQFQRTIFQKQFELKIRRLYEIEIEIKLNVSKNDSEDTDGFDDISREMMGRVFRLELDSQKYCRIKGFLGLESLLKKCTNIKSFEFKLWRKNGITIKHMLRILISKQYYWSQSICDKIWLQFIENFDSKVVSLSFTHFNPKFVNRFTYLRVLKSDHRSNQMRLTDVFPIQIKNLRQIHIDYYSKDGIHLQTFVEKYKCLTHLNINVYICDRNAIKHLLTQLSRLKELIHFEMYSYYIQHEIVITDKPFVDSVNQLINNWTKLKSFGGILCPIKDMNGFSPNYVPIRGIKQLK